jgi:hypothetical protein
MNEAFPILEASLANENQAWNRRRILFALAAVAQEKDQARMEMILQAAREDEPELLQSWFVKHPSDKAKEHYRKLTNGDYGKNSEFTLILAAMRDRDVVEWAKKTRDQRGKHQWVRFYVLATSPLVEADDEVGRVLRGKGDEAVIWLVQGYRDSNSPFRMKRVEQIAERKNKSKKLIFWLRSALESDGFREEAGSARILKKLPVVESERE